MPMAGADQVAIAAAVVGSSVLAGAAVLRTLHNRCPPDAPDPCTMEARPRTARRALRPVRL